MTTLPQHSFRFQPLPGRSTPEAARDFAVRLRRALRAAHGLGLGLHLHWSSGPAGGVVLTAASIAAARWVQFGLASAYEVGQWAAKPDEHSSTPLEPEFIGRLAHAHELPLPAGFEEAPWCESVLGELSAAGSGVSVAWEMLPDLEPPAPEGRPRPVDGPTGEFHGPPTLPERGLRDRQEARRIALRWRVRGEILVDGRHQSREEAARVAHLIEATSLFDGGNRFEFRPARSLLSRIFRDAPLTEAELVGLFPPPFLMTSTSRSRGAPTNLYFWLGRDLKGSSVGLPFEPNQGRHLLILGETGMGKSSLVVRLAWQAARWGSVVILDPIGDTVRELLAGVPNSQTARVSWMSPSALSLTLNLLHELESGGGENPARRERLIGDIVGALRRVRAGRYAESSYWGPRLEEMLSQSIRAASRWPGASLSVAERLLTPEGIPGRNVPETARDVVGDLRRRIERAPQDGDGARRLLSEITRSELLRELLDADVPTWSVSDAIAPGHLSAISGDAPRAGESVARYLLAVVLALVWNAVLVRDLPSKTFLILEEAQWYAHESVAEMLRLGRRFNLHVWAVTQSLSSLPDVVREAFATNAADLVMFRGAPSDVRDISRWLPAIAPEGILRMPRGEAAVLIDKGTETRWVRLPPLRPGTGDVDRFRVVARVGGSPSNAKAHSATPGEAGLDANSTTGSLDGPPFLEVLKEYLHNGPEEPEMTIRPAQLRSRWSAVPDLAERRVRSGGRLLVAKKVLLRSGRDGKGSYWVLSRDRLEQMIQSPPVRDGQRPSSGCQPAPDHEEAN